MTATRPEHPGQPWRRERIHAPAAGEGPMLTIGLLGGMSWESTAEYYRLL